MQISTLRKIVHALGSKLEILARFPKGTVKIDQFDRSPRYSRREGARGLELVQYDKVKAALDEPDMRERIDIPGHAGDDPPVLRVAVRTAHRASLSGSLPTLDEVSRYATLPFLEGAALWSARCFNPLGGACHAET